MGRKRPKEGSKSRELWERKRLARKCLKLWGELIRERAGGMCEVCGTKHGELNEKGSPLYMNPHHIEEKMNWATRFDPDNGILLCPGHHKYFVDSAHRSSLWITRILKQVRDKDILKRLWNQRKKKDIQRFEGWTLGMLTATEQLLWGLLEEYKKKETGHE